MITNRSEQGLGDVLRWRLIGPHRGGRVVAVAGVEGDPVTWYFGACAGGVWKTRDAGISWRNVSDGFFQTSAVGAIAVSTAKSSVVYVGLGESTLRNDISHGDGVYRSLDAGETWTNVGLAGTRYIAKIRIHPQDPNVVYVAALGHVWGPNSERGVYRSINGGQTWEQVLFVDESTGAIDISIDPLNPNTLYAALWEFSGRPWNISSGGPLSGLYRSMDGGDSWQNLSRNPGFPASPIGKIGVAASPAQSERVWALVESTDGGLFLSDDRGATWTRQSTRTDLIRRPYYFTHLVAHPVNPNTVFVLNYQAWRSIDAGMNFTVVPTPHDDTHDLWIDSLEPNRMILGSDGGAHISLTGGGSWAAAYNQPTAQLYRVCVDSQVPYRLYVSQQDDHFALSLPSVSMHGAISTSEWEAPGGGESGWVVPKPDDPNVVIGGAIGTGPGNGRLIRYDRRTGQMRNISIWPEFLGKTVGPEELTYRFYWTFPILFSPHDHNVLYVAANLIFRSTDLGENWEPISPDLTRQDRTKLGPIGGPVTPFNNDEAYCTISSLIESKHQAGTLWAGSDDGLIYLGQSGARNWRNVTPESMPEWATVTSIDESPHSAGTAYVTATRYKLDDPRPYVFKTTDWGGTWEVITTGFETDAITRVVRADPVVPGLLFCGTESRVMFSDDDGQNWKPLHANLPVCPVYDLLIKDSDLIAATHGRSVWILDDITPLRQMPADGSRDAVGRLLEPRPTYRYHVFENYTHHIARGINYGRAGPVSYSYELGLGEDGGAAVIPLDAGQNPPNGALITYQLFDDARDIRLVVRDQQGRPVRVLGASIPDDKANQRGLPCGVGYHRIVWDLRSDPAAALPGDAMDGRLLRGPVVPPGIYSVVMTVDEHDFVQPLSVLRDPRLRVSDEDLEEQFQLRLKIRDQLTDVNLRTLQLRDVRRQLRNLLERNGPWAGDATETLRKACEGLDQELVNIEDELVQGATERNRIVPSRLSERLAVLGSIVESADARPTKQLYALWDDLEAKARQRLETLSQIITQSIPSLNLAAREANAPYVTFPTEAG